MSSNGKDFEPWCFRAHSAVLVGIIQTPGTSGCVARGSLGFPETLALLRYSLGGSWKGCVDGGLRETPNPRFYLQWCRGLQAEHVVPSREQGPRLRMERNCVRWERQSTVTLREPPTPSGPLYLAVKEEVWVRRSGRTLTAKRWSAW